MTQADPRGGYRGRTFAEPDPAVVRIANLVRAIVQMKK
jgi:hypothetical protein